MEFMVNNIARCNMVGNTNGILNKGVVTDQLLLESNIPQTATSYSCAWSGYDLLIFSATQYSNIASTVIVPTSYFSGTSSGTRVLLYSPQFARNYQIYQNGNNAVYMSADQAESTTYRIRIYGVKLA